MAKTRSVYVCNECGATSAQYFGRCAACGSWNSLVEQVAPASSAGSGKIGAIARTPRGTTRKPARAEPIAALTLNQITDHPQMRVSSGYGELDRVLGGGIVPGSLVLIGGDPGIGKSTLLLQSAYLLAEHYRVLYVCAEESGQQVKLRA